MKPEKKAKPKEKDISYRSAVLNVRAENGPSTIDPETRSVDIILSTEAPARVYSYELDRVVVEILLMSGAQLPINRQLVMLDAHSRYDTEDVIGSARNIRIENNSLIGRAYFSSAPEAEGPWTKVREGHLTDFSIGYRVDEAVWIPDNQSATIDGRVFQGPLQVAVKWTPREISAVPIGADQNAKARAEINQSTTNKNNKEDHQMNPEVRKMLETKGLSATATEEEAVAFLAKLEVKSDTPAETDAQRAETEEKIRKEATGAVLQRIREIDALCQKYECADMARSLIIDGVELMEAQRKVLDHIQAKSKSPGVTGSDTVDAKDKFRAAAEHGIMLRAGLTVANPAPGASELRGFTLAEMARECLRASNLPYRDDVKTMVGRAMTSSDFPYILAAVANKSMQDGWNEASETWPIWTSVGSVSDFKTYYDNQLSEFDDLEEIPDSGEIKLGAFSEARESFAIKSYGKKFKVTRVMIINDDMGAFTQMPAKRAEAANRKIGDVVYGIITANGNMGDGNALFDNTNHGNDAASGFRSAPGIANLNEADRAMGMQKDMKGLRRLNIRPEYFLAPRALKGVSEIFFKSEKFSDAHTAATDSSKASTQTNIWSGDVLKRIYEARLDDDSVSAWYLLGPKEKTVKVVFLNGKQGPILEMNQPGFSVEGFEYAVVIDVGAYAQDWRAFYRNEGA